MGWRRVAVVALLVQAACGADQRERDAAGARAPDSVALAAAAYDPALFDSISFAADTAAINRGAVVWVYSCQKCHGATGAGDGNFVMRGDTLRPPSFREPDWRFATDADGLMRQIFTGTNEGMPHWGLVGLKPRDIVAVTRFIQAQLISPDSV